MVLYNGYAKFSKWFQRIQKVLSINKIERCILSGFRFVWQCNRNVKWQFLFFWKRIILSETGVQQVVVISIHGIWTNVPWLERLTILRKLEHMSSSVDLTWMRKNVNFSWRKQVPPITILFWKLEIHFH